MLGLSPSDVFFFIGYVCEPGLTDTSQALIVLPSSSLHGNSRSRSLHSTSRPSLYRLNQAPMRKYFFAQILLVIDAADALCESGGKQARASLATFLDEMCCTDARLKLLVTCEEGILESTDQFLSNSKERVGGPITYSLVVRVA